MLLNAISIIFKIGIVFLSTTVFFWAWGYKKYPQAIRILGVYLTINLAVQIGSYFLSSNQINNLPLLHFQTLIEWIFFSLFFRWLYLDYPLFKKHLTLILAIGSIALLTNSLLFEPLNTFNSASKSIVQLFIIGYVFMYLFDAFGRVDYDLIVNRIILLICFGILLNYAGSLFIFMFERAIPDENLTGLTALWLINSCLSTLFQFIVMIAYIMLWRNRQALSTTE